MACTLGACGRAQGGGGRGQGGAARGATLGRHVEGHGQGRPQAPSPGVSAPSTRHPRISVATFSGVCDTGAVVAEVGSHSTRSDSRVRVE
jgi:hypothetical protein